MAKQTLFVIEIPKLELGKIRSGVRVGKVFKSKKDKTRHFRNEKHKKRVNEQSY